MRALSGRWLQCLFTGLLSTGLLSTGLLSTGLLSTGLIALQAPLAAGMTGPCLGAAPAGAVMEWTWDVAGEPWSFVLARHDLRARGMQVLVGTSGDLVEVPSPNTWRGEVYCPGRRGRLAATIDDRGFRAVALFEDGELFDLLADVGGVDAVRVIRLGDRAVAPARCFSPGRLAGSPPAHVPRLPSLRGTPSKRSQDRNEPRRSDRSFRTPGVLAAGATHLVELAVDMDQEFFALSGGSIASAIGDVESVLNAVEMIFEAELSLRLVITACVVRPSEPDPFTTNDPLSLMNQLAGVWNGPLASIPRDTTHLFTGKNLPGNIVGFSNTSVACFPSIAYGLSESFFSPSFAARVALTAHELGHNLGASHCSGSGCHIMCGTIGGCGGALNQFGSMATQQISSFVLNSNCLAALPGPLPLPFAEAFGVLTPDPDRWQSVVGAEVLVAVDAPSGSLVLEMSGSSPALSQQDSIESVSLALGSVGPAQVLFEVRAQGLGVGDALVVEVTDVSGGWHEVARVISPGPVGYAHQAADIPAAGLFDGSRIRFRTDGTGPGERFFIDDLRVEAAAPNPPTVQGISPSDIASLGGAPVTLIGGGFLSVGLQVSVDGFVVAQSSVTVVDDQTLVVSPPVAKKLGPVPLVVSNGGGAAPPVMITFFPPDPPVVQATPIAFNGQNVTVQYAGVPGELPFLLAGSGKTFQWNGALILDTPFFLPLGLLQSAGVALLSAPVSGVPAGTTIYLQVLTVDGPGAAQSLAASNISQVFVLF